MLRQVPDLTVRLVSPVTVPALVSFTAKSRLVYEPVASRLVL